MGYRGRAFVAGVIVLAGWAVPAHANFAGNIEAFSGTSFDLQTWAQSYPQIPGDLTQNNKLIYNGGGDGVSYNTISRTVAWGQGVRVRMRTTEANAGVSVFLTDGSAGPSAFGAYNSTFWSFDLDTNIDPTFNRIIYGSGTNGGGWGNGLMSVSPQVNVDYWLQIEPLSMTQARFTLFNSGLTVLQQVTFAGPHAPVPNNLYISLTGTRGSGEFDDVTIIPIPEPAVTAGAMMSIAAAGMLGQRRRITRAPARRSA